MAYILAFFLALCFLASLFPTPGVRVTDPRVSTASVDFFILDVPTPLYPLIGDI